MSSCSCFKVGAIQALDSKDKFAAIRELIQKAPVFTEISNLKALEDAVIMRENLLSTACGHGIAFAHGKTEQVREVLTVLGISREGIDFSTPDGKPVNLLFLIASPPNSQTEYLSVLSCLARIFHDQGLINEVLKALSFREIEKKISGMLKVYLDRFKMETS
jgi:PTS system nitrogen regulatory IIA component